MTTNIQLAKPGGGFHSETNGVDDAVARSMVASGAARLVTGDTTANEPVVDGRGKGVTLAAVDARIDSKLRSLEARVLQRLDDRLRAAVSKPSPIAELPTEVKTPEVEPTAKTPTVETVETPAVELGPLDTPEPPENDGKPDVDFDSLPDDLTKLSVNELRKLARKLDIDGRSKMNEEALVAAIDEIRTA